jgi:uncharacterized protein YcbX
MTNGTAAAAGAAAGTIRELWRYPVKSMGGERLDAIALDERGPRGDRLWAIHDQEKGAITTAKRLPALLLMTARYLEEPGPEAGPGAVPPVAIRLPDGSEVRSDDPDVDDRLSAALGRRVSLSALRPASDRDHFRTPATTADEMRAAFGVAPDEPLPDFSSLPVSLLAELARYATPRGTYVDAYPVHLLTTASLAAMRARAPAADFDPRRFRANLLIESTVSEGLVEREWAGGALRAGEAALRLEIPTVRCSMPSRAQPDLPADPLVMKTVAAEADRCLGLYATVARPGRVSVGDTVHVEPQDRSRLRAWTDRRAASFKRALLRAVERRLPRNG